MTIVEFSSSLLYCHWQSLVVAKGLFVPVGYVFDAWHGCGHI
jgi:hypothetical protein